MRSSLGLPRGVSGLSGIGSNRRLFGPRNHLDKQLRHTIRFRPWSAFSARLFGGSLCSLYAPGLLFRTKMALNVSVSLTQLLRQRSCRIAIRSLATASSDSTPASMKPSFASTLDDGPSLDDFIVGNIPERVVLGNAKTYVLEQQHIPICVLVLKLA
jgi:hypothetical protein